MSTTTIARRYAEALADVALSQNSADRTDDELRTFVEMMRSSRELYGVFASPVISQADKGRVLDAIVARARPSQTTANLLRVMLGHYRLHLASEVYVQFRRIVNERRGAVVAEVTTAAPIGPAEQERMRRELTTLTGKQVQFKFNTDPSLIGGVVTRIGSVIYDGSIRTQLQEIKQRLKSGGA